MENNYEITGYSISNYGKEQNGDSYLCEYIAGENILIAMVADGVSKQPCDWLASRTACEKIYDFFKQNQGEKQVGKRVEKSIQQANSFILQVVGACYKMASTLSILVWPTGQDSCYLANIGDSRIYSSYQGQLQLLTKDDAIMFKERVLMHGGLRIIDKSMLNKVIGMSNLQISVTEKPLREEEIIILATDGFYDARKSIYTETMAGLSLQQNLEESFQKTVKKFEILRGDDFTVVMIKKRKHSR